MTDLLARIETALAAIDGVNSGILAIRSKTDSLVASFAVG